MSRIPIMNSRYSLIRWSVGLHFFLTTIKQEFIFNQAQIPHSGDLGLFILVWIQVQLLFLYVPKQTKLREKACQYLTRTSQILKVMVHYTCLVLNYASQTELYSQIK